MRLWVSTELTALEIRRAHFDVLEHSKEHLRRILLEKINESIEFRTEQKHLGIELIAFLNTRENEEIKRLESHVEILKERLRIQERIILISDDKVNSFNALTFWQLIRLAFKRLFKKKGSK